MKNDTTTMDKLKVDGLIMFYHVLKKISTKYGRYGHMYFVFKLEKNVNCLTVKTKWSCFKLLRVN